MKLSLLFKLGIAVIVIFGLTKKGEILKMISHN
jgi:hypothetical protein